MIPKPTIPKNKAINFTEIILFKIIASGKLRAVTAIIKAKAVPKSIPLAVNTSTKGITPAALEYIGIPINTAAKTAFIIALQNACFGIFLFSISSCKNHLAFIQTFPNTAGEYQNIPKAM